MELFVIELERATSSIFLVGSSFFMLGRLFYLVKLAFGDIEFLLIAEGVKTPTEEIPSY